MTTHDTETVVARSHTAPLTVEMETFCEAFAKLGCGAAAFRLAYPSRAQGNGARQSELARRLRTRPPVAARIAVLQALRSTAAPRSGEDGGSGLLGGEPDVVGLTAEDEAFCRGFVRLRNGAEAYRAAFPVRCQGTSSNYRSLLAYKMRKRPLVAARIAELKGAEPTPVRRINARQASRKPTATPKPRRARDESPASMSELERLALIAFDDRRPDALRLIALRALTANLIDGAARPDANVMVITITIGGNGQAATLAAAVQSPASLALDQPAVAAPCLQ